MTADELREHLDTIPEGNPWAAVWRRRLDTAADPDAEAEKIVGEVQRAFDALRPAFDRIRRMVVAIIRFGHQVAEAHAETCDREDCVRD